MSQYIVSARKYRPDSFETLVGQDNIAQTLKNSIQRGQLAHAYLFCGPRGVGKTSTARIFAKTINCSNPGTEMEPCGECESCRSFAEGRSYCIHELDAASNNGVEDIKALMEQVQIPPQVGRYSVFIIDEVHMLSPAAFNAFLKTLEEPPSHAIFILATTEKHKIIPTILSRCQTYDFNRITVAGIVSNLRSIASKEGVAIDDESLHVIAQKADGAMRDALTLFDQAVAFCGTDIHYADVVRNLGVLDYEMCFSLVDSFLASDYAAALTAFDDILSKGFNAQHFISALSSHLRDLLVSRTAGLESLLDMPDSLKAKYSAQAQRCDLKFLYDALEISGQCEALYKASINPRLHIEFALMKMSFLCKPLVASQPAAPATPAVPVTPPAPAVPATAAPATEAPAPSAPQPRARRSSAKTGASLSFTALMQQEEKNSELEMIAQNDRVPSSEEVPDAWNTLVGNYADKPRLYHTLHDAPLAYGEFEGALSVTFKVDNQAQKLWIEERMLKDMEIKLRELLSTSKVRVFVDLLPQKDQAQTAYTPEEKAREIVKENRNVKDFIAEMGWDIN